MPHSPSQPYDEDFYVDRRKTTLHSAKAVLGVIRRVYEFRSVVDVGCGTGTWLTVARECGATVVQGFEGDWLSVDMLDDRDLPVDRVNLEESLKHAGRYDLCICLEVAEHLSPERAEGLVTDLCSLSRVVLFSAAIPGQGGDGHLNEHWPSYWADLFARIEYTPRDIIRPAIWQDSAIPYWYRQNVLVFSRDRSLFTETNSGPLDIVHPEQFATAMGTLENTPFQDSLGSLKAAIRRRSPKPRRKSGPPDLTN